MFKHEFDALMGYSVCAECFIKIDWAYTFCPLFSNENGKAEMAEFYRKKGACGVERLYHATNQLIQADGGIRLIHPDFGAECRAVLDEAAGELFEPDMDGGLNAGYRRRLENFLEAIKL